MGRNQPKPVPSPVGSKTVDMPNMTCKWKVSGRDWPDLGPSADLFWADWKYFGIRFFGILGSKTQV